MLTGGHQLAALEEHGHASEGIPLACCSSLYGRLLCAGWAHVCRRRILPQPGLHALVSPSHGTSAERMPVMSVFTQALEPI